MQLVWSGLGKELLGGGGGAMAPRQGVEQPRQLNRGMAWMEAFMNEQRTSEGISSGT
jgi:hypothetical protein